MTVQRKKTIYILMCVCVCLSSMRRKLTQAETSRFFLFLQKNITVKKFRNSITVTTHCFTPMISEQISERGLLYS